MFGDLLTQEAIFGEAFVVLLLEGLQPRSVAVHDLTDLGSGESFLDKIVEDVFSSFQFLDGPDEVLLVMSSIRL